MQWASARLLAKNSMQLVAWQRVQSTWGWLWWLAPFFLHFLKLHHIFPPPPLWYRLWITRHSYFLGIFYSWFLLVYLVGYIFFIYRLTWWWTVHDGGVFKIFRVFICVNPVQYYLLTSNLLHFYVLLFLLFLPVNISLFVPVPYNFFVCLVT